MNRQIIDEETGIGYTLQDNYYLPNLALPAEENQHIGIWGQRYRRYLKEHHRILYYNLLTACKWIDQMNNIRNRAIEIVNNDLIYS